MHIFEGVVAYFSGYINTKITENMSFLSQAAMAVKPFPCCAVAMRELQTSEALTDIASKTLCQRSCVKEIH